MSNDVVDDDDDDDDDDEDDDEDDEIDDNDEDHDSIDQGGWITIMEGPKSDFVPIDMGEQSSMLSPSKSRQPKQQQQQQHPEAQQSKWNDDAILRAFHAAVASHDKNCAQPVPIDDHKDSTDNMEESQTLKPSAFASGSSHSLPPPSHNEDHRTNDSQKQNGTAATSSQPVAVSSWEPRPLPLPTWAIDLFMNDHNNEPVTKTTTATTTTTTTANKKP